MLALLLALTGDPKPVETLPPLVEVRRCLPIAALSPVADVLGIATAERSVVVINLAEKRLRPLVSKLPARIASLVWTPDGSMLAIVRGDGRTDFVDAVDGKTRSSIVSERVITEWNEEDEKPVFLDGGRLCALSRGDHRVDVWSIADGKRVAEPMFSAEDRVTAITASPDGRFLAVGSGEGEVRVWRVGSWAKSVAECQVPTIRRWPCVCALDFNQEGTQIAIGGTDCIVRIWKIGTADALREYSLCDWDWAQSFYIGHVRFNAQSTALLATTFLAECTLRVWDVETGHVLTDYRYHNGDDNIVRAWFSPDGQRVVCSRGMVYGSLAPEQKAEFTKCTESEGCRYFGFERDYAWAVVNHELIVRKIPDAEPVLRVRVRE